MSDQPRPSSRVSLEDLLRLKRAERPPAEFWLDFEKSLRGKQLAAIVEKRPWWRTWPSLSRWSVPLGAAAALTMTVTLISHGQRKAAETLSKADSGPVSTREVAPITPAVEAIASLKPIELPVDSEKEASPALVASVQSVPLSASAAEHRSPAVAEVPELGSSMRLASVSEQIAGLGVSGGSDQSSSRFTAVAHKDSAAVRELNSFFERAVAHLDPGLRAEKSASVEPLSQIQSPRDARRARLLAYTSAIDTHSPQYSDNTNVIRSRERITSHLSEEALYDSIRRLGIKNGGVSIRF